MRKTLLTPPSKFISLHAHDGFSTFDGLGYPQEHIDFVIENGMDGWCLTNHGHMNSFGHAFLHAEKIQKRGGKFKFVPGCEMYVHPDLEAWHLDYDIRQAAKKGDKKALFELRARREAIATPLTAIVDGDDEIIDIGSDDIGLTIENEDETKSSKFYDPVKRRHHLVVLPKTSEGLQRLFHLVSRGYREGFYRFPRIDYRMLREAAEGGHLMVSTACIGGPLAYEVFRHAQQVEFDDLSYKLMNDPSFRNNVMTGVGNAYQGLVDAVGMKDVHLEIQFNQLPAQHLVNRAIIEFAQQEGIEDKLVVTTDSHYARPEHWRERELYKKLGWLNYRDFDPSKLPKSKDDLKCELYPKNAEQLWDTYLKSTEGMEFYDDELVKAAIERPHQIVHEEIQEISPDRTMKLPSYVVPEGQTDDRALLEACKEGLIERGLAGDQKYIERLKYELQVIKDKKFSRYFLTMTAIINIAKKAMLVGPGRGSAAGSLVAYVLRLTDVDPFEYDLMFERFLNPSRKGAPDIDTDVGDRDLLLHMMKEEWGDANIVPISNYNTFKLKSLVKDISRFYGIPFNEVNKALSSVDEDVRRAVFKPGTDKNLFVLLYEDALAHSKKFSTFIAMHPEVAEPIQVLFKQNKALGRHAGGCIVAEDIAERMPLIKARGELQTPWAEGMNYKHLETFGWIKFDLLGLETLRIIQRTIELILHRKEGIEDPTFDQVYEWFNNHMDPKVLDMNDQHVYTHVYAEGRFPGVFQLANRGSRNLFRKAKPKSIVDIATLTSIYRPGPLTAKVDRHYIKAKNNPESVDYGHPLIKEVLEETYGMIVFQEQIMKLCSVVAGFPEEETDTVRRSIMKRKASEAAESLAQARGIKTRFVAGAVSNGVDEQLADDLYEKILYFSGYGFNKAHAVSYAIDSYYCAWLLTYYEEEWLCAYLEAMSGNDKKRAKAFAEVKALGYDVVPLDINYATKKWTILEGKKFMPSLLSCKGIGEAAIDELVMNRPYENIDDLLWTEEGKWRHSKFNKRALEALINIRAFESMNLVGPGNMFESYKHMHEVLINRNTDIKKWTKRDPERGKNNFKEALLDTQGSGRWSRRERVENSVKHFGSFNASTLISGEVQERLVEKGIQCIDGIEANGHDLYWFLVSDVKEKLTKNKRPYLLVTATGLDGKNFRMFCWGWDGETELPLYSLCVAEIKKNDFGYQTSMSKVKRLRI
jgi:DNA polymerase-3 subunit alpha